MNITFLCGSLEPGNDGVGDYTRRLAAELIRQGHTIAIIALNDRHTDILFTGSQFVDKIEVPVMRLPTLMPMKNRYALAADWIKQHDPEWLSLQYVPFGYHPKGLKVGLSRWLRVLGKYRKWHIMFHELWVGMSIEDNQKLIWWGRIQRFMIRGIILALKPKVIHTQTHLYQALLKQMGFDTGYLPLFGNIKEVTPRSADDIALSLKEQNVEFVVFGSVHPGAPISEFAREAAAYGTANNITMTLLFAGRSSSTQLEWANHWQEVGLPVKLLGRQSEQGISTILTGATIGLSATPIAIVEKSGSFAAMRDHGLPVISIARTWTPAGNAAHVIPAGIIQYQPGNFDYCMTNLKPGPAITVSMIAADLIIALSMID